ncbi:hypothetical protein BDQ12DRAFT_737806 [Crucibulum laeve]|uniref:Uncharacterized protein n=1 Tax=Crucibulum laeve TaxID=68775 RepID=A0A5C3LT07_9AGAR|nr:hypothetical protein BDQ12DRAFT_737806 [Crucibulum laeve]
MPSKSLTTSTGMVQALFRTFGTAPELVSFTEFHGNGEAPVELGEPGDIYIRFAPEHHKLFAKDMAHWKEWTGLDIDHLTHHPTKKDRILWCSWTSHSIGWYCSHRHTITPPPLSDMTTSEVISQHLSQQQAMSKPRRKRPRIASDSELQGIKRQKLSTTSYTDASSFSSSTLNSRRERDTNRSPAISSITGGNHVTSTGTIYSPQSRSEAEHITNSNSLSFIKPYFNSISPAYRDLTSTTTPNNRQSTGTKIMYLPPAVGNSSAGAAQIATLELKKEVIDVAFRFTGHNISTPIDLTVDENDDNNRQTCNEQSHSSCMNIYNTVKAVNALRLDTSTAWTIEDPSNIPETPSSSDIKTEAFRKYILPVVSREIHRLRKENREIAPLRERISDLEEQINKLHQKNASLSTALDSVLKRPLKEDKLTQTDTTIMTSEEVIMSIPDERAANTAIPAGVFNLSLGSSSDGVPLQINLTALIKETARLVLENTALRANLQDILNCQKENLSEMVERDDQFELHLSASKSPDIAMETRDDYLRTEHSAEEAMQIEDFKQELKTPEKSKLPEESPISTNREDQSSQAGASQLLWESTDMRSSSLRSLNRVGDSLPQTHEHCMDDFSALVDIHFHSRACISAAVKDVETVSPEEPLSFIPTLQQEQNDTKNEKSTGSDINELGDSEMETLDRRSMDTRIEGTESSKSHCNLKEENDSQLPETTQSHQDGSDCSSSCTLSSSTSLLPEASVFIQSYSFSAINQGTPHIQEYSTDTEAQLFALNFNIHSKILFHKESENDQIYICRICLSYKPSIVKRIKAKKSVTRLLAHCQDEHLDICEKLGQMSTDEVVNVLAGLEKEFAFI